MDGETAPGTVISPSYADTRPMADVDADGLTEFLAHGGTIGSAGAGPRPWTEVWGWDGAPSAGPMSSSTNRRPTATTFSYQFSPTDGCGAIWTGRWRLYEASIIEGTLRDDGFVYPPEQTRADSSCRFRLILIDPLQNNVERANSRLAWPSTYLGSAVAPGRISSRRAAIVARKRGSAMHQIEKQLAGWRIPPARWPTLGYGNPSLGAEIFVREMGAAAIRGL